MTEICANCDKNGYIMQDGQYLFNDCCYEKIQSRVNIQWKDWKLLLIAHTVLMMLWFSILFMDAVIAYKQRDLLAAYVGGMVTVLTWNFVKNYIQLVKTVSNFIKFKRTLKKYESQ